MKRRAGIPIDICYKYKNRHMDIRSDMNNAQSNHAEDEKTADNSEKCIVDNNENSNGYEIRFGVVEAVSSFSDWLCSLF